MPMEKTILDFLNDYMKKADGGSAAGGTDMGSDGSGRLISFHMPGHKGRRKKKKKTGYGDFLKNIVTCDITEIPGADALFCPETTLRYFQSAEAAPVLKKIREAGDVVHY